LGPVGTAVSDFVAGLDPVEIVTAFYGRDDWGSLFRCLAGPVALCGAVGGVCVGLAVWRLRPVALRQMEGALRKDRKVGARQDVDEDDPVRWKERVPGPKLGRWLAAAGLAAATAVSALWII